jgi:hypothetical protein
MNLLPRCGATLITAVISLGTVNATAQSPPIRDANLQPAAAVDSRAAPGKLVRFTQRPSQVGDQVSQQLAVHLQLKTTIIQSGQTAHESEDIMRRQQRRVIEVLEAIDGRATQARATFPVSRRQSPENRDPAELATQPIEGKTYLMQREGDRLQVTDLAGHTPPLEEFKLVVESLENVGKPSPLASLLMSRPVTVGQRILVPRDLVQQLLGFDDPVGSVRRFEIMLSELSPATEQNSLERATFKTRIEIVPNDASPLTISLQGEMVVETATCRLTTVQLKGPVSLSSIERTAGGIFQYSAGGELRLAIRSDYGSVASQ